MQRYVRDPMLVDGRKFDIRAFALVTHDLLLEGDKRYPSKMWDRSKLSAKELKAKTKQNWADLRVGARLVT